MHARPAPPLALRAPLHVLRFLLLLLLLLLLSVATARPHAGPRVHPASPIGRPDVAGRISHVDLATGIDALAAPAVDAGRLSGVILITRRGEPVVSRTFGFASWELRAPITPSHRFGIGSITKALTENLVSLLVEEGRLDLGAPVERYLEGFPRGPAGGAPTLDHLLNHRAGVPHRVTDATEEALVLGAGDIVERVRATGLLFEPGSQRLYSSAGFTSLARVIETVEGAPFARILDERVLGPAGMARATDETARRPIRDRAVPHRFTVGDGAVEVARARHRNLRFLTGAGSVYATAADLERFVEAMRRGVFGEHGRRALEPGRDSAWVSWYGRTSGYEASLDVLPSRDLVVVFLSNLPSAANWQLRAGLRDLIEGRRPRALASPPAVADAFEPPGEVIGLYGRPSAPVEVSVLAGGLFRAENEIHPIDDGGYYIPASGSVMRFRRDASGRVDAIVTVSGAGRESVLPRLTSAEAP